jgi:head-tail adaptor
MSARPWLYRKLTLENREVVADKIGGYAEIWTPLGVHWADVQSSGGREPFLGDRDTSLVRHRILVRAAPEGSVRRPKPDQRFKEGARAYHIMAVSEYDERGQYLVCWTEERNAG